MISWSSEKILSCNHCKYQSTAFSSTVFIYCSSASPELRWHPQHPPRMSGSDGRVVQVCSCGGYTKTEIFSWYICMHLTRIQNRCYVKRKNSNKPRILKKLKFLNKPRSLIYECLIFFHVKGRTSYFQTTCWLMIFFPRNTALRRVIIMHSRYKWIIYQTYFWSYWKHRWYGFLSVLL